MWSGVRVDVAWGAGRLSVAEGERLARVERNCERRAEASLLRAERACCAMAHDAGDVDRVCEVSQRGPWPCGAPLTLKRAAVQEPAADIDQLCLQLLTDRLGSDVHLSHRHFAPSGTEKIIRVLQVRARAPANARTPSRAHARCGAESAQEPQ
jgi:hypothetical protein